MPIYGYQCKQCGASFQTLVRSGEQPACPSWGAVDVAQHWALIAPPAGGGAPAAPAACANAGAGPSCAACPGAAMFG